MKTKLLAAIISTLTAISGAAEMCPHDGEHGDDVVITVDHNGQSATRRVVTAYMIEEGDGQVIFAAALEAFNETSPEKQIATDPNQTLPTNNVIKGWDFYRWMTKVEDLAVARGNNIDGDEEMFADLYERQLTPEQAFEDRADYPAFERWMYQVREIAPKLGLTLSDSDAESDEEYFFLYHWQSTNGTPDAEAAVLEAKKFWEQKTEQARLEWQNEEQPDARDVKP